MSAALADIGLMPTALSTLIVALFIRPALSTFISPRRMGVADDEASLEEGNHP